MQSDQKIHKSSEEIFDDSCDAEIKSIDRDEKIIFIGAGVIGVLFLSFMGWAMVVSGCFK